MFHVLKSTYLQPPDVVEPDSARPSGVARGKRSPRAAFCWPAVWRIGSGGVLITADMSAEDAQDIVDRDPYTHAGVARYERSSFNGAYRAPGL